MQLQLEDLQLSKSMSIFKIGGLGDELWCLEVKKIEALAKINSASRDLDQLIF